MTVSTADSSLSVSGDGSAFPWGLELARLRAPQGGQTFAAKVPTASGALLVSCTPACEAAADALVEGGVARLLHDLPAELWEVAVIDSGVRKRFHHLAALPGSTYRVYRDAQEIDGYLAALEKRLAYRHHECLGGDVRTLSDFNRNNAYPERYVVLVLCLDAFRPDERVGRMLAHLLRDGMAAGLYAVLLAVGGVAGVHRGLIEDCRQRFPEILLDAEGWRLGERGEGEVADLQALIERFGLILESAPDDTVALLAALAARAPAGRGVQDFLSLPIGRSPNGRREIHFRLGKRSGCNHAFILGVTRSGKTTLLNHLIVQIAEQFTARELQLYLMDYKEGAEFQIFDRHPNCRRIHLDNADREAASALLDEFAGTIRERARLFKACQQDVSDIDAYNALNPQNPLPRLLLIIDEVHVLLKGSGATEFNMRLKQVVRQGGAFGIHLILSTQTLSDYQVDSDLLSQIGGRIAFRLTLGSDCSTLFEFGNDAAKTLEPYHFVYNADFGLARGNEIGRGILVEKEAVRARVEAARAQRRPDEVVMPELTDAGSALPPAADETPSASDEVGEVQFDASEMSDEELEAEEARLRAEDARRRGA